MNKFKLAVLALTVFSGSALAAKSIQVDAATLHTAFNSNPAVAADQYPAYKTVIVGTVTKFSNSSTALVKAGKSDHLLLEFSTSAMKKVVLNKQQSFSCSRMKLSSGAVTAQGCKVVQ